jgi:hypothetical protein
MIPLQDKSNYIGVGVGKVEEGIINEDYVEDHKEAWVAFGWSAAPKRTVIERHTGS